MVCSKGDSLTTSDVFRCGDRGLSVVYCERHLSLQKGRKRLWNKRRIPRATKLRPKLHTNVTPSLTLIHVSSFLAHAYVVNSVTEITYYAFYSTLSRHIHLDYCFETTLKVHCVSRRFLTVIQSFNLVFV